MNDAAATTNPALAKALRILAELSAEDGDAGADWTALWCRSCLRHCRRRHGPMRWLAPMSRARGCAGMRTSWYRCASGPRRSLRPSARGGATTRACWAMAWRPSRGVPAARDRAAAGLQSCRPFGRSGAKLHRSKLAAARNSRRRRWFDRRRAVGAAPVRRPGAADPKGQRRRRQRAQLWPGGGARRFHPFPGQRRPADAGGSDERRRRFQRRRRCRSVLRPGALDRHANDAARKEAASFA